MMILAIPILSSVNNPEPDTMMPDVELEEVNDSVGVQQQTIKRGISIIHNDFKVKDEPMDAEDKPKGTPRRSAQLKGKGRSNDSNGGDLCPASPNLEEMTHKDMGQLHVHLATC
jgi:hypothetical protein